MTQTAPIDVAVERGISGLNAIIVGTGRCGSTMLSNIFRQHQAVLSLSEFFSMLQPPLFTEELLDAQAFWHILAAPNTRSTTMVRPDITLPELLYPFTETSRFSYTPGAPPILLVALPHLTDDYEAVYDELEIAVSQFPTASITEHFAHLFNWLKARFGHEVTIERSGLSLPLLPDLIKIFPHTKLVHLVRDGKGCVWSMYRHPGFRLAAFFEGGVAIDLEEIDNEDEPAAFDLKRIINANIPFEAFGTAWTRNLIIGLQTLAQLPEEQVLTVKYEDIIADPQRNITQIIDFIDPSLYDANWIKTAATMVKETPAGWKKLPRAEREALEKACESGQAVTDLLMQEGLYSPKLATLLTQLSEQYS